MRTDAETKVLTAFHDATRHLLPEGIEVCDRIRGSVYTPHFVGSNANFMPRYDICGESEEIRFEVRDGDMLSVGWGGNSLILIGSNEKYERVNQKKIEFIASIIQNKDEWVRAIKTVDWTPIQEEEERKKREELEKAQARENELRAIYETANVKVDTVFEVQRWKSTVRVVRMSKTKIQMDDGRFYSWSDIAKKLEAGEWQVKQ